MDKKGLTASLQQFKLNIILEINYKNRKKKKDSNESFNLNQKDLLIYASLANLLRLGPATKPTRAKSTKERTPTAAA